MHCAFFLWGKIWLFKYYGYEVQASSNEWLNKSKENAQWPTEPVHLYYCHIYTD